MSLFGDAVHLAATGTRSVFDPIRHEHRSVPQHRFVATSNAFPPSALTARGAGYVSPVRRPAASEPTSPTSPLSPREKGKSSVGVAACLAEQPVERPLDVPQRTPREVKCTDDMATTYLHLAFAYNLNPTMDRKKGDRFRPNSERVANATAAPFVNLTVLQSSAVAAAASHRPHTAKQPVHSFPPGAKTSTQVVNGHKIATTTWSQIPATSYPDLDAAEAAGHWTAPFGDVKYTHLEASPPTSGRPQSGRRFVPKLPITAASDTLVARLPVSSRRHPPPYRPVSRPSSAVRRVERPASPSSSRILDTRESVLGEIASFEARLNQRRPPTGVTPDV